MQEILTRQDYKKYQVLKQLATSLRKQLTPYEKKLWSKLRNKRLLNILFHRQQILLNSYIVDFYAPKIKLAIEIDGGQHNLPEHKAKDKIRDERLIAANIVVKRYSNLTLGENLGYVMQDLYNYIKLNNSPL